MSVGATEQQSAFVTVIAWVFIIVSGFATFIAIMQNIVVHFLFSTEQLQRAMQLPASTEHMPVIINFMFSHVGLVVGLILLLALLTLIASIGLLLRKHWARFLFIALMGIVIVWNIGSLVLQELLFSMPDEAPANLARHSQGMMTITGFFSIVLALALSLLCGWIVWRLSASDIRREFDQAKR